MASRVATFCRDHPLATACALVFIGAGTGYAVAVVSSGKLADALWVASTTLVFGALLGGAVKFLLEDLQRLREQREERARFVKQVLDDLKSVHDRVERTRILIAAHRSALTYGNEMRDLINSAVQLRNVTRALDQTSEVLNKYRPELKLAVEWMTAYVDSLTGEFEANYKRIADKQDYYEVRAKRAREGDEPPPENEAWDDMRRLGRLAEFLGIRSHALFCYGVDFGKTLNAATWILRAELESLKSGSRLEMPHEHAITLKEIASRRTARASARAYDATAADFPAAP